MNAIPHQIQTIGGYLSDIGYRKPTGSTVLNYDFNVERGRSWTTDLLAFGDPRRFDISTSCIAVQWWPNGGDKIAALHNLRHIGTPLALFATPNHVEIWPVSSELADTLHPRAIQPYDGLSQYFSQHKRDLAPNSILLAKKGERQLTFFDVDPSLESFARQATQETLTNQFMETIAAVSNHVRQNHPQPLTRVAISVLAARIMQDKLKEYPDLQVRDIKLLLNALQVRFPNYFSNIDSDIESIGQDTLILLYQGLGGFTFRSLTNDMLAYFYENVFVDERLRRKLGIYYTPRYITERILKHLPLENKSPEDRVVLDGTCGSGNMLLAAYDRLNELLPVRWSLERRHSYLLDHILGIDTDPFACEIARLSLLLYDLPMGDSWQIETADVFEVTPYRLFKTNPDVIVSNPPFNEPRSTDGKRVQTAAEVLKKYLDWLPANGLLGIVVPLTFLNNASVANERNRLLTECDILEVWHFLQGAVSHWSTATAIILARKLPEKEPNSGNALTRVIEVIGTDGRKFQEHDNPTFSYLVPQVQWINHPKHIMDSSSVDHILQKLDRKFGSIHGNFALLYNGMQPGKEARETHFSKHKEEDIDQKTLYNNVNGKFLEPYRIDWRSQEVRYVKYPGDLQWPRNPEHFEAPKKVILNATRNAGGPWRFYAAIDDQKLIPTENFHYALPTGNASIEEIAVVLNSQVANTWFASRFQGRDVNLSILKQLPFPSFDKEQIDHIQRLVNSIANLKKQTRDIYLEKVRSLILALDEIVFDGYQLSNKERQQIREWIEKSPRPRPGIEWAEIPKHLTEPEEQMYQGQRWILTGEVKAIDIKNLSLSMQIDGQETEIPIPANMPGWALRPNVVFEATVPWHQAENDDLSEMTWLEFEPLGYDYLTDDELFANLIDYLNAE